MDTRTFKILQILADQVLKVAQILSDHPELLTECEGCDLEYVKDTLKDCFNLQD